MALLSWLVFASLSCVVFAAPQVQLNQTTLTGDAFNNQEFFGGIPFAESPIGALRFAPPVRKASLNATTFNATSFSLACLQTGRLPSNLTSEDCLTINILRPAGLTSNASLPVMAWVFGGGFVQGSASDYNGTSIVRQSISRGTPIIYVNFNYRLGPLGFPRGVEAGKRGALNLGIKDVILALEWVQENIGSFGGDKSKVTVFGESSGAAALQTLYYNSNLQHLARAAIMESGTGLQTPLHNSTVGNTIWKNFVAAVPECASVASTGNTFECLRTANTSTIIQAFKASTPVAIDPNNLVWYPVLDGPKGILPDLPSKLLAEGKYANVPFIAGTNRDESTYFTPQLLNSTAQIRDGIIAACTPSPRGEAAVSLAVDKLLQLYPDDASLGSPFETGNNTFGLSSQYKRAAALLGDFTFQSPRRLFNQRAAKDGVKAYGYLFTDPSAQPLPTPTPPANGSLGVAHGSEMAYIYEHFAGMNTTSSPLRVPMVDYWISFAVSLEPNDGKGSQRPDWHQYTSQNATVLQLSASNTTLIPDDYRSDQMKFMNADPAVFSR